MISTSLVRAKHPSLLLHPDQTPMPGSQHGWDGSFSSTRMGEGGPRWDFATGTQFGLAESPTTGRFRGGAAQCSTPTNGPLRSWKTATTPNERDGNGPNTSQHVHWRQNKQSTALKHRNQLVVTPHMTWEPVQHPHKRLPAQLETATTPNERATGDRTNNPLH